MRATSFLVGVFLIFGALEVRRTSCYMAATPESDLADTVVLPGCNRLDIRERCIMGAQSEYRTFDGTCNNLCNITNGAAGVPFSRLPGLEPPTAFAPGFKPRVASVIPGKFLQPSRKISTTVFAGTDDNVNGTNPNFTHVTMTWGQFIDHDVTLTPLVPGVECGSQSEPCQDIDECVNIPLVKPLANNSTLLCIPLRRALQDEDGEQQNIITSYVDASMVYGSSLEAAEELRDPENPKLLAIMDPTKSETEQRCALLPPAELEAFCRSPNTMDKPCFKAGDERVNENQALMAMHTLWVREHNRIARKLAEINPTCDDEEIYQLARKIVAAEIQHITYNEWLTVLFSAEVLDKANLTLVPPGEFFKGYDPSVDATIHNSFGAAVLRIGHTLIRSSFNLIANSKIRRSKRRLYRGSIETDFFTPQDLFLGIKYNFIDEILHGLTVDLAQLIDNNFVTTITENLVIEGPIPDGIVGDLTAINIERGRDHGLPPYVNFREFCGAGQAKFFPDLLTTTTQVNINKLKQVYATVLDIDLFPGGLLEFPAKGSAVGFTYTCLLTEMFKRLRFGDRFWYERDNSVGFTLPQLDEIRKASLARVYCDNTASVIFIQPKVFVPKTNKFGDNPVTDCDFLPMVDLEKFKKEPEESNAEVPAEVPV